MKVLNIMLLVSVVLAMPLVLWAETSESLVGRAQEAYEEGEYEQAIHICKQLLKTNPDHPQALFCMGQAQIKALKTAEGLRNMEKAVKLFPSYSWCLELGNTAQELHELPLAIRYWEAALIHREDPDICQKLSWAYDQQGDFVKGSQMRSRGVALEIPKVRQLAMKKPIECGVQSTKELQLFLAKEMDKEITPQKALAMELSLLAFGFIQKRMDIKQLMLKLMGEQIAGFYNPEDKHLYLIGEKEAKEDDAQDRMVIAHEMTHALQDQHFDLLALEKKTKDNDDRSLASQALVEGDATLAMMDYQIYPRYYTSQHAALLKVVFSLERLLLPFLGGQELGKAPNVIRENLLFPYVEGLFFALALRGTGAGYANVDQAFTTKLPASTEHILHPEKYLAGEMPSDFELQDISSLFGQEWKQVENNVLGEFFVQVLMAEFNIPKSKNIAEGWGGDRYSILQAGEQVALAWLTTWDTETDAQEFFSAYKTILSQKYPEAQTENSPLQVSYIRTGDASRIAIQKQTVIVVEKIPTDKIVPIWDKLMAIEPKIADK